MASLIFMHGLFVGPAGARTTEQQAAYTAIKAELARQPEDYSARKAELQARGCDEFDDFEMCEGRALHAQFANRPTSTLADAFPWYEKACALGGADSCRVVAGIYGAGEYVPKDLRKSVAYYQKACTIKGQDPCKMVDILNGVKRGPAKRAVASQTSTIPDPSASYLEHLTAMRGVTATTSMGTNSCNMLIGSLDRRQGELYERWRRLLRASFRSNNQACNTVPVAVAREIESELAAARPELDPVAPPPSGGTYENSSTLRDKWIKESTPLSCYVRDGRRVCNK